MNNNPLMTTVILFTMVIISSISYASNNIVLDTTKKENQQSMQPLESINKVKGDSFLKENSQKLGVITLPSGLQYKILRVGNGPKPGLNDSVTVHYSGNLINGTVFDSSYERREPATFPLMGVIAGWTEALQLMTVGSQWELYIPANLAYGTRGAPPTIGPNEVLIFKIELISINKLSP